MLIELAVKLVFGAARAAWWVVKGCLKLMAEVVRRAFELTALAIGGLISAGAVLLWASTQQGQDRLAPSQPHDLGIQATRLGLEPADDGTARGRRSGIELHLVPIPGSGWRLYAQRPHQARVSVWTASLTVPSTMVRSALQLAEYNRGKGEIDQSLD